MLTKVRFFSQHIYNDKAVCSDDGYPFPLEDKIWLRQMAWSFGKKQKLYSYFSDFVYLLQDVGRIWAAQLLKNHRIDLHQLEIETYSFLQLYKAESDGYDYRYYVDHYYSSDNPNTCCVQDDDEAKELLGKIKNSDDVGYEKILNGENKKGAMKKKFADFIINKTETNKVINIIKQHINKEYPKQTALVIIGGIEAGKIRMDITSTSIEKEFGVKGNSVKPYLTKYKQFKDKT